MPTIGFIGGGNMAASLIGGLINAGMSAADITVAEPDKTRRLALNRQFDVSTSEENNGALNCDIIILAVKPQLLKNVCQQLVTGKTINALFISIAAGVKSADINRWLTQNQTNAQQAIVRCMPNTPALIQCGATGLFANEFVNKKQKQQAEKIMQAVGIVIWVKNEEQLNAVTAVSGSGPAYFFLLMEAIQQAGEQLGSSARILHSNWYYRPH